MPEPLRVVVGALGSGMLPNARSAPPAGTLLLDLGPDHPSRAGLLELDLWVEDGVVAEADVRVGALHRGAEKLYEVRDYRQILMLADRHDWQSPFTGELGIALACEDLLGIEVPQRAVRLRTLLAEHSRIASHLAFLSYLIRRLARTDAADLRAALRRQLQDLTGNRIHPMVSVVGGLAADAHPDWLRAEVELTGRIGRLARTWASMLDDSRYADRLAGLAPTPPEVVAGYGITGPAARAAGVAVDLRVDAPYLAYRELDGLIRPPSAVAGDARSRFAALLHETAEAAELVRCCADLLLAETGPVAIPLPQILRLPEGETAALTEAPLGWAGCWLVSRGEKTPWRLKLRTPSFNHVAALPAVLPGCPVSELEPALASIGYVIGDVDK